MSSMHFQDQSTPSNDSKCQHFQQGMIPAGNTNTLSFQGNINSNLAASSFVEDTLNINMMKISLIAFFLVGTNAFSPLVSIKKSSTSLNLFGGGGGNKDGGAKKPNMMDQLGMFKKAQEIAQKKKNIENELAKIDYTGTAADGKVTATVKVCFNGVGK